MRILASMVLTAVTAMTMTVGARAQTPDPQRICLAGSTPADEKLAACSAVITDPPPGDSQALASVYVSRGNAYREKRQFDPALQDYDSAIGLNPGSVNAYFGRGLIFVAKAGGGGDAAANAFVERAIADYSKVLELRPNSAGAQNNRGQLYLRGKKYDLAIADFTQAIQNSPNNPLFFKNRAVTYALTQKYDLAIADYGRALTLKPDDALRKEIETALDDVRTKMTRGTKAETPPALPPAQSQAPAQSQERTLCLAGSTPADQRIASCSAVIASGQGGDAKVPANIFLGRGNAYLAKADYAHALADYDQATRLDPSDSNPFNRASAYRQEGRFDQALQDYTRAIEIDPLSSSAYFGRAVTFMAKADYDFDALLHEGSLEERAIADYSKVLELAPKNGDAYNNRGNAYLRVHKNNLAVADLTQAIQLDPSDPVFITNRAIAYAATRQYNLAIADYRQALTLKIDADTRKRIGKALDELGAAP
jgi:tetratricopeptide (TPR) repeat protein